MSPVTDPPKLVTEGSFDLIGEVGLAYSRDWGSRWCWPRVGCAAWKVHSRRITHNPLLSPPPQIDSFTGSQSRGSILILLGHMRRTHRQAR